MSPALVEIFSSATSHPILVSMIIDTYNVKRNKKAWKVKLKVYF